MRLISCFAISAVLAASVAPTLAMPRPHRGPTSPRLFKSRGTAKSSAPRAASAVGIAPERATQIQTALIKSGYMTGEPTGVWDSSTQAAMEKMQADNGWQTKLVPDSRAIIKLGLGPSSSVASETGDVEGSAAVSPSAPSNAANQ